jgi:hypothetical protein
MRGFQSQRLPVAAKYTNMRIPITRKAPNSNNKPKPRNARSIDIISKLDFPIK